MARTDTNAVDTMLVIVIGDGGEALFWIRRLSRAAREGLARRYSRRLWMCGVKNDVLHRRSIGHVARLVLATFRFRVLVTHRNYIPVTLTRIFGI